MSDVMLGRLRPKESIWLRLLRDRQLKGVDENGIEVKFCERESIDGEEPRWTTIEPEDEG